MKRKDINHVILMTNFIPDRYLSYLKTIDVIGDGYHERVLSGILANRAGTTIAWEFFWNNFDTLFKM